MCLGAPAVVLVVDYDEKTATVDYGDGVPRKVLIGISDERVERGNVVIVHAGVIVSKISENEIMEQIEFFKQAIGQEAVDLLSIYLVLLKKSKELNNVEA